MKRIFFLATMSLALGFASAGLIGRVSLADGAGDLYTAFARFAAANFGAESDPLVYTFCGDALAFVNSGTWTHSSQNALTLSFETSLPAKSSIEFGQTSAYGLQTAMTDEYHFLHLHYLTGLSPATQYHYRFNAVDERGNVIHSPDAIIQTADFRSSAYIPIPGSLAGPPYVLNQANKTYYLTKDITAPARAITIAAAGVNIDLNGFTIFYDAGTPIVPSHSTDPSRSSEYPQWTDYFYSNQSTCGIYAYGSTFGNAVITGGKIQQAGNNNGTIGVGFNPILLSTYNNPYEIAGVSVQWNGGSANGIYCLAGNVHIHHNALKDMGWAINDRHVGTAAIFQSDTRQSTDHNLILRARHVGIRGTNEIFSNEIFGDSWAINGYLIRDASYIHDNKLFGTGYHSIALNTQNNAQIFRNLAYMVGDAPNDRNAEYGVSSSVNAIRITQYAGGTASISDCLIQYNTFIIKARNGTTYARGIEVTSDPNVKNVVFLNNTVKAVSLDDTTTTPACIVAQGSNGTDDTRSPVFYRRNTLISNTRLVAICDEYGCGGNHRFETNTFIRTGSFSSFHTLSLGYWEYSSYNNRFIDSILTNCSIDDAVNNQGGIPIDYSVGHTLHVILRDANLNPIANKTVTVKDNSQYTYQATTDSSGRAALQLLEYTWTSKDKTPLKKSVHAGHLISVSGLPDYALTSNELTVSNSAASAIDVTIGATVLNPPANLHVYR
jgi:hypothetical protein